MAEPIKLPDGIVFTPDNASPSSEGEVKFTPDSSGKKGRLKSFYDGVANSITALPDAIINDVFNEIDRGKRFLGLKEKTDEQLVKEGVEPAEMLADKRSYLMRMATHLSHEKQEPFLGLFKIGTGKKQEPGDLSERLSEKAGEGVGGALGMLAGGMGAKPVQGIAPELLTAKKPMEKVLGHIEQTKGDYANQLRTAPIKVGAAEVISSATGGAGGEAGKELGEAAGSPMLANIGEQVGNLVGGAPIQASKLAGQASFKAAKEGFKAVSPVRWGAKIAGYGPEYDHAVSSAVEFVKQKAMPGAFDRLWSDNIGAVVKDAYQVAEVEGRLDLRKDLDEAMQGVHAERLDLNAAQETGHDGLIHERNKLNALAKGSEITENQQTHRDNLDRVKIFSGRVLPTDDAAPSMVINAVKKHTAGLLQKITMGQGVLAERAAALSQNLPKLGSRADENKLLQSMILVDKDAAKQEMDNFATFLGIDRRGPREAMGAEKERIAKEFIPSLSMRAEHVPSVINDIVKMPENNITFDDWKAIRGRIGDDLSKALAHEGNTEAANALTRFKAHWDDMGARLWGGSDDPAQIGMHDRWDQFSKAYSERYMPYETGAAYKVTKLSPDSRPTGVRYETTDERIAQSFLKDTQEAAHFMKLSENKPEMRDSMRNILMDQARDFATPGPNSPFLSGVEPNRLAKWVGQKSDILKELGLLDQFNDVANVTRQIETRNASLAARKEAVQQSSLYSTISQSNASGAARKDPELIIDEALTSRPKMVDLVKAVKRTGDPGQLEQLRVAVTTRLMENYGGIAEATPDKFLALLDRKGILGTVFDADHMKNLKLVAEGFKFANTATANLQGSGLGPGNIDETFTQIFGTSIQSMGSRITAAREGRNSPRNVALLFGTRFLNQRGRNKFYDVMKRGLASREDAELLASPATPDKVRRAEAWMFNGGINAAEHDEPKQAPKPTVIDGLTFTPDGAAPPTKAAPPPAPVKGTPAPLMQTPDAAPPPTAPGPSPAPPAPELVGKQKFGNLFPFDELGGAIAARGYAEGGSVRDWRLSDNVEDRRSYDPYKDDNLQRELETNNNVTRSMILRKEFASGFEEAMTRKRTAKEQKGIEDQIHFARKQREKGYPLVKDPFLRSVGALVEPREAPRPKMASELEWGEKPGTMTHLTGIETLLRK